MLRSSPTSIKPPDSKSILLIGPPGGGKTILAMSFPETIFLDCDRNLDGPERVLRGDKTHKGLMANLDYGYIPIGMDDKGNPRPTNECFDYLLDVAIPEVKAAPGKAVSFDSLLHINEYIITKVMKDKRIDALETRHYEDIKQKYYTLLARALREINKTVIVTCHEKAIFKSGDSKNMMEKIVTSYQPRVAGDTKDALAGFFTDCWRCWSQPGPADRVEFCLQTNQDIKYPFLKNSLQMEPKYTVKSGELMWNQIKHLFV